MSIESRIYVPPLRYNCVIFPAAKRLPFQLYSLTLCLNWIDFVSRADAARGYSTVSSIATMPDNIFTENAAITLRAIVVRTLIIFDFVQMWHGDSHNGHGDGKNRTARHAAGRPSSDRDCRD
jgi:hypothetical protein